MTTGKTWKDRAIEKLRTIQDKDELRTFVQKECRSNCHVVDFNYHCRRCRLVKASNQRMKELEEGEASGS